MSECFDEPRGVVSDGVGAGQAHEIVDVELAMLLRRCVVTEAPHTLRASVVTSIRRIEVTRVNHREAHRGDESDR